MGGPSQPPHHEPERTYEVEWTTISYRTIAFYVGLALVLCAFILYLIAPHYFGQKIKAALNAISSGLVSSGEADTSTSKRDAHFVNVDGTVRVKKGQSQQWIRADYNTSLEKGDFVQTASDGVARIIFSSSAAVYGEPRRARIDELHPKAPVSPYGRTKWMIEQVLGDFDRAYRLRHSCLRYFNAAGADPDGLLGERHEPETHLIPLALRAASVAQVFEAVRRVSGLQVPVVEAARRAGDPARLVADCRRARSELGWRPRFAELDAIVAHAWAWERRQNRGLALAETRLYA